MSASKATTRIVARLTTKEQITSFVNSPGWSIRELQLATTGKTPLIDMTKFSKLSGLNFDDNSAKVIQKQINFINNLHECEVDPSTRPRINSGDKMTFAKLTDAIRHLKQDDSKGEGGNWHAMDLPALKSGDYYVLREGLYKKNKTT